MRVAEHADHERPPFTKQPTRLGRLQHVRQRGGDDPGVHRAGLTHPGDCGEPGGTTTVAHMLRAIHRTEAAGILDAPAATVIAPATEGARGRSIWL
jgi:hypothetical protein